VTNAPSGVLAVTAADIFGLEDDEIRDDAAGRPGPVA
jgi:hypothetical protein